MTASSKDQATAVTVLVSGGVESAALLSEALVRYERVYPVFVRKGLGWESTELLHLKKVMAALESDGLARLTVLEASLVPIYERHWSLGSVAIPGAKAPDAAVYLPGRNLLLLGLAGLFCSVRKIPVLWLGILRGNPFRDARAGFIRQFEELLEESLGSPIRIVAPFRELTKAEVIKRWPSIPWGKTFSCLRPVRDRHCGRCQKCAERRAGFRAAGVVDPTVYVK